MAQHEQLDLNSAQYKALLFLGLKANKLKTLYKLEMLASHTAELWANGLITDEAAHSRRLSIEAKVRALFTKELPGLLINFDPRGYAIKLSPDHEGIPAGLCRDWGDFAILAPDCDNE